MKPPRAIATVASAICRRPIVALLVLAADIVLLPALLTTGQDDAATRQDRAA